MWYITWATPPGKAHKRYVCYAESEDGIHWAKPNLGLVEDDGSRENNIIIGSEQGLVDCLGVIDDPKDREWPLKMIYWYAAHGKREAAGLYAARSRDGVRWDLLGRVLPWGDRTNIMPHLDHGKYVIFGRDTENGTRLGCRVVSRTESDDLTHWGAPRLVLKPDTEDPPHFQVYSATAFRYESAYLGFIERMHMTPDVLDPEIWWSHDGWAWRRSRPRQAFIERGPQDAWDAGWVNTLSSAPIPWQGELMIHYSGRAHGHRDCRSPARRYAAIGVAQLRIDGFCSLYSQEREGWLVTPAMRWPKAELAVNVDPRRDLTSHPRYGGGQALVEARNAQGRPIEGFTFADCEPMTANTERTSGNDASATVLWKAGRRMASLAGRNLRLAFRLRDAHLYSFKARREAPPAQEATRR
jgi:hypothetical protein